MDTNKEQGIKERDWEADAATFKKLDELIPKLHKAGLVFMLGTDNQVLLCNHNTNIPFSQLSKTNNAKLADLDEEVLKYYLYVQRVAARKGIYVPGGYVTYTINFQSDFRNNDFSKADIGKLLVDVPFENECFHNGIQCTISPDVTKADAIQTLQSIIKAIEENDNFEDLQKTIKVIEAKEDEPSDEQIAFAKKIESGTLLKNSSKDYIVCGGRLAK